MYLSSPDNFVNSQFNLLIGSTIRYRLKFFLKNQINLVFIIHSFKD
jgi:hypothetical protein